MQTLWQRIKKKFKILGPGFITGAADDDPSGIATYSIAGASFGYKLSFLSWLLIPMMIAIQETSARIGLVTGQGLAGVIKKFYSKKLLFFVVSLLTIANTINIGADLGIMADTAKIVTGWPFEFWLIFIALTTILLEIFVPYKLYAGFLRWLSLFLLVYVLTAFLVTDDWLAVLIKALIPSFELNTKFLMATVGFLGTTISPYLFFWQASEEVEEEILEQKISDFAVNKPVVSGFQLRRMRRDTSIGMVFSNLIAFFIIATTAATLNAQGITTIDTPRQAALALKPLAGDLAFLLFTVGIIGIGLQSIPVLAGTVAYAISESLGFSEGLSKKFSQAKLFYIIIALATVFGILINLWHINTISTLFYTAIINGIIAVPLIFVILKMADDKKVVGNKTTPRIIKFFGWMAFWFMLIVVFLMFASLLKIIK